MAWIISWQNVYFLWPTKVVYKMGLEKKLFFCKKINKLFLYNLNVEIVRPDAMIEV